MNEHTRAAIQSTFAASNEGQIHFGEAVRRLQAVEVESYHVDYRTGRTTYYLPDGAALDFGFSPAAELIPGTFDRESVLAAIRGAQQGRVMYPEFKALTQRAGCIGYTVWMAGRHVTYFGRKGETHVEWFPD